jgi:hypothetical protein
LKKRLETYGKEHLETVKANLHTNSNITLIGREIRKVLTRRELGFILKWLGEM